MPTIIVDVMDRSLCGTYESIKPSPTVVLSCRELTLPRSTDTYYK